MFGRTKFVNLLLLVFIFLDYSESQLFNIKRVDCPGVEREYKSIVEWYFRRSQLLSVIDLTSVNKSGSFSNNFLREYFSGRKLPRFLKILVTKIIFFYTETTSSNHVPVVYRHWMSSKPTPLWTFRRKTGVLVIADSFAAIQEFFNITFRQTGNLNRDGDFMFTVTDNTTNDWDGEEIGQFFRGCMDFDILNPLFVVVQCGEQEEEDEDVIFGYYDTFEFVGGYDDDKDDERNWGAFHWTTYAEMYKRDYITGGYVNDFHGYPLRVNQFFRYPTAISKNYVPQFARNSYIYKSSQPDGKW